MPSQSEPKIMEGGVFVDERGIVSFVNEFDFQGVERSYIVCSHRPGQPRGWVGHKRDEKWFWVIKGTSLISVVKPDDWDSPSRDLSVRRYVLSQATPQVLHVPAGYATANVSLCADVVLMVFASGRIEDAKADDFRFGSDTWPIVSE